MKTLTPQILGMYLGCRAITNLGWKPEIECMIGGVRVENVGWEVELVMPGIGRQHCKVDQVKPILRRLEDMTEGDLEDMAEKERSAPVTKLPTIEGHAESVAYLLSKHFDLFGLIDAGLAIDAKTLQQEP